MAATEGERKKAFFSSIKKQFARCLEPCWTCENPSIRSHSVQNASALSLIEEDGHVMEMRMNFNVEPPQPEFRSIGRNDASTFPGFCQTHDADIFRPIDTKPLDVMDLEQLFLLAYRSVSRELHAIMDGAVRIQGALNFLVETGEVPSNEASGPMIEATVQLLKSWGMYKYRSKFFDSAILRKQFGGIKHSVFKFENEKPILAASSFFSIKPPKRPGHLFPGVSLNVVPTSISESLVVFSYASEHSGDVRRYIAPIILSTGETRKLRLSEMIVCRAENFFVTPSKVASWTDDKRRTIETVFKETMLRDQDPAENKELMLF